MSDKKQGLQCLLRPLTVDDAERHVARAIRAFVMEWNAACNFRTADIHNSLEELLLFAKDQESEVMKLLPFTYLPPEAEQEADASENEKKNDGEKLEVAASRKKMKQVNFDRLALENAAASSRVHSRSPSASSRDVKSSRPPSSARSAAASERSEAKSSKAKGDGLQLSQGEAVLSSMSGKRARPQSQVRGSHSRGRSDEKKKLRVDPPVAGSGDKAAGGKDSERMEPKWIRDKSGRSVMIDKSGRRCEPPLERYDRIGCHPRHICVARVLSYIAPLLRLLDMCNTKGIDKSPERHVKSLRTRGETQIYPGAGSVEGKMFVRNARHYFPFVSLNTLPGFFEIAQCTCCGFVDPFQKSSGIGYMSDAKKRELQKDATLLGHTLCSICGDLFHSAPAAASSSGSGQQEDAAAPRKWHNGRGAGDKTELETPAERARVLRRHHEHVMKYRRRDFEGTAYVVTLQKSAAATVNLRQKLATSCDNFAEVETNDRDVPKPRYKKSTDRITVEKIFGDSDRHNYGETKGGLHLFPGGSCTPGHRAGSVEEALCILCEVNKMLKILGKHPNVAQLLRADPQTVTLVCEYGGESLNEFVLKEKLKAEQYADLRKQLQTIAEYLWKVLVLHLDWKMENLVLMQQAEEGNKDKMRLRVIDFGNSQFVPLPTAAEAFVPDQDVAYTFPFVCRKFMETKREIANKEGSAKFTAKLLEEQLPAETLKPAAPP
eukprot:g15959.t1